LAQKQRKTPRDTRARASTPEGTLASGRKMGKKSKAKTSGASAVSLGSSGAAPTKKSRDKERKVMSAASGGASSVGAVEDDFDVDALFGAAKKAKKLQGGNGGGSGGAVKCAPVEEEKIRVLLPGQKKPKQKRVTPEFTPVDKPRRFEDGLPVFKSYDDFSDMAAGQLVGENGKKLGPNGEPGGDCPFDCWCCF
jgi:hypothetical protein